MRQNAVLCAADYSASEPHPLAQCVRDSDTGEDYPLNKFKPIVSRVDLLAEHTARRFGAACGCSNAPPHTVVSWQCSPGQLGLSYSAPVACVRVVCRFSLAATMLTHPQNTRSAGPRGQRCTPGSTRATPTQSPRWGVYLHSSIVQCSFNVQVPVVSMWEVPRPTHQGWQHACWHGLASHGTAP